MNKEQLAVRLNNRQYGSEITTEEEKIAEENGLLVIFGASDDLIEFRGLFCDELGCRLDAQDFYIHSAGVLEDHDDCCNCNFCGYEEVRRQCFVIAAGSYEGYTWKYASEIPHSTFEILEGEEKYCRGMVIDVKDLPKI